jgi:hypothetical protein
MEKGKHGLSKELLGRLELKPPPAPPVPPRPAAQFFAPQPRAQNQLPQTPKEQIDHACLRVVVLGNHPETLFEQPAMVQLFALLRPGVVPPSRKVLKRVRKIARTLVDNGKSSSF